MLTRMIFYMCVLFGPIMSEADDKIYICFIGMVAMMRVMYNEILKSDTLW